METLRLLAPFIIGGLFGVLAGLPFIIEGVRMERDYQRRNRK